MTKSWLPAQSRGEIVALEDLGGAPVQRGIRYWREWKGGRTFPARDDIVLRELGPALAHVLLVRVLDEGRDYEYRIVGDALVQGFLENFAGRRLSQVTADAPQFGDGLRFLYDTVRSSGQPMGFRFWVGNDLRGAEFCYFESVILPFGLDGKTVDHLLVFCTTTPHHAITTAPPPAVA